MLNTLNLLLLPVEAAGVPSHVWGHNNATTPVGMYFRYKSRPLAANDVV